MINLTVVYFEIKVFSSDQVFKFQFSVQLRENIIFFGFSSRRVKNLKLTGQRLTIHSPFPFQELVLFYHRFKLL